MAAFSSTVAAVDVEALEREALAAIAEARSADELEEVRVQALGRKSPLKLALREVRDRESGMALNAAEAHPSRDPRDTFYLDDDTVLRTHTSPSQTRAMRAMDPPVYIASLGRVYRRDTLDATHTPIFHQVEALAVDRDVTLADLRGTMRAFAEAIFGGTREIRMRTSFFPFTEPSVEFDMTCFLCDGAGCAVCKHSGWIEMGGAGEVDPSVLEGVGYDPGEG